MSADANLSSCDLRVECLLERFERERVANKSSDLVLSRIAGEVFDEQFLEVAGLHDFSKMGPSFNDIHVADIFSQPMTVATSTCVGLTPGLIFDMSRSCWDLNVRTNAERLCEYLQTERPVLKVGLPKCKAFMDLQSMDRRDPKFQRILEAGLSHLKSLMEIYHCQSEQGRWFLHEDPHHSWSQSTKALQTLESVSGARVTKTKQLWHVHHNLPSGLSRNVQQVLQILRCCRSRLSHQFCEVCDEHWKRSPEPLATWKLDRLWKSSAPCRRVHVNPDKSHMAKPMGCRLIPKLC